MMMMSAEIWFDLLLYPYNNLRYFTWAQFMSDGFKVSYVIRAAMKNLHNILHNI